MRRPDWQSDDGSIQIHCCDCLTLLPQLEADAVVTDPPYDKNLPVSLFGLCSQLAIFGYAQKLVEWCILHRRIPDEWVVWWPTNGALKAHYRRGVNRETEHIAVWGHRFDVRQPRKMETWDLARRLQKTRKVPDVWRDASPGLCFNSHLRQHPNEKPVGVMDKLARLVSQDGDTIIDPFMGSGTTGVACVHTGRKFIGCEIEPKYFKIAVKRIKAAIAERKEQLIAV